MPTIKQINEVLEEGYSLKLVTQAYSEIAAAKLQKIRAGIEKNRSFFQEISEVFHIVRVSALKQHILLPSNKKGTVSILMTSNERFYGNLELDLIKFFVLNTTKFRTDRMVVGKTALEFFQTMHYFHPVRQFVFKEDVPSFQEMKGLVAALSGYQQISVYYPRMQSVMVQEPHVVDIIQKPPERYLNMKSGVTHFIFEPEIDKMLQFFDTQITTLLLEQTFLEAELARTAARLISMDSAQLNADEFIKKQKSLLAQAVRSVNNTRLLETIVAISQWKESNLEE